ncbi:Chromodomain-helicase-DNA-binding protein 1-like [Oopsacas minuta]|uniref:Chromodomain-helicase-DNA-binding protein 1-like n=1 Tax=Oopsacas minuta TaxID=111878 RepID=A0AAV7JLL3_9METZ|nr:Chromodomain-helicase-DNA-binding protein 1-like [Oopsacas minuta]
MTSNRNFPSNDSPLPLHNQLYPSVNTPGHYIPYPPNPHPQVSYTPQQPMMPAYPINNVYQQQYNQSPGYSWSQGQMATPTLPSYEQVYSPNQQHCMYPIRNEYDHTNVPGNLMHWKAPRERIQQPVNFPNSGQIRDLTGVKSVDSNFPEFDLNSPNFEDFQNINEPVGDIEEKMECDTFPLLKELEMGDKQKTNLLELVDDKSMVQNTSQPIEPLTKKQDNDVTKSDTEQPEEEDLSKAFCPEKEFKEDSDEELIIRRKRPAQKENEQKRKDSDSEFKASSSELEKSSVPTSSPPSSGSEYGAEEEFAKSKKLPPKKRLPPVRSTWVADEYRRSAREKKPTNKKGIYKRGDNSSDDETYSSDPLTDLEERSSGSEYSYCSMSESDYSTVQDSSTESDLSFLPKRRKASGRKKKYESDSSDVRVRKKPKKDYSSSSSNESATLKRFRRLDSRKRPKKYKKNNSDWSELSDDLIAACFSPVRSTRRVAKGVTYKEASDSDKEGLLGDNDSPLSQAGEEQYIAESEQVDTIERILLKRTGIKETEYLIKWANMSYLHNTWETESNLIGYGVKGIKKVSVYEQKCEEERVWAGNATPEDLEEFQLQQEMQMEIIESHTLVERVISVRNKDSDSPVREHLCKWEGLPYTECTWEEQGVISDKFQNHIDDYYSRQNMLNIPHRSARVSKNRPNFKAIPSQPKWLGKPLDGDVNSQQTDPSEPPSSPLVLRDYQLEGLNWLVYSWCKHNSVILADEMGLGKTIQTIAFLHYLYKVYQLYGPFLIVVRLSTLAVWQREFAKWAPELNIVVYIGDAQSRGMIKQYEWENESGKIQFNVLITTYEILLRDKEALGELNWAVLAVDEGHRLKNDDSMVYQALMEFSTQFRMCITGTPLQNSLRELWCLLHFTQSERFPKWEEFEKHHRLYDEGDASGLDQLHAELQPYLLRRVKRDVEKSLPSKVERILTVEMSALQREYYRHILTRNFKALMKTGKAKAHRSSFINVLMELQKCCNHAHLTVSPDEDDKEDRQERLQHILRGSGKMVLLDKLLTRMKERGHRVLIFSQMVRMLDIISDYLQLKRWQHQRLDGSIKREDRQIALDHFNADNSTDFCFLLSTKAGGLGINLATADTVVIYDSDWNPQNDLQAQARAHRIGQKKQVNIYRIVTKNSIEVDIIERAKRKMVLDHLVIQRMDTTGRTVLSNSEGGQSTQVPFSKDELDAVLKFGAAEIFREDGEQDKRLQEMDIDALINQAETATMEPRINSKAEELLSQFKIANIASLGLEGDDTPAEVKTPKRSVSKSFSEYPLEERQNLKSWEDIIPQKFLDDLSDEELYKEQLLFLDHRTRSARKNIKYNEVQSPLKQAMTKTQGKKASSSKSRRDRPKSDYVQSDEEVFEIEVEAFDDSEIRRFIKSYNKFPRPESRIEDIAQDSDLVDRSRVELTSLITALQEGCDQTESKNGLFQLGGVLVSAKSVIKRMGELENLAKALPEDNPFSYNVGKITRPPDWGSIRWSSVQDSMLLVGISLHGFGNWQALKADKRLNLSGILPKNPSLRPQTSHLKTRAETLLKKLERVKFVREKSKEKSSRNKSKKDRPEMGDFKRRYPIKIPIKDLEKVPEPHAAKGSGSESDHSESGASNKMEMETFEECKKILKPVKKALNKLERSYSDSSKMSKSSVPSTSSLLEIGGEIDKYIKTHKHDDDVEFMLENLWKFVSLFTPVMSEVLLTHYKRISRAKTPKRDKSSRSHMVKKSSKSSSKKGKYKTELSKTGQKRRRK